MNPETLERDILDCKTEGIVNALEGLNETERKKLSGTVQNILKDLNNKLREFNFFDESYKTKYPKYQQQLQTAEFAALGLCPFSVTKKITGRYHNTPEHMAYLKKLFLDRKPEWINEWVEERLKGEWQTINWFLLRDLIKEGLCKKPKSEGYTRLMVTQLPHSVNWQKDADKYELLSARILKDPDLLEDEIWRLFEVENAAFTYEYTPNEKCETWCTALCKLSESGKVDRQKLINSCLSGLTTGFKNNSLSGYIKVHDKLNPTIDELFERQQSYLDLLSNRAQHVVTFALKILKELDKKKKLNAEEFVRSIGSIFAIKSKTQPVTALKILENILKSRRDLTSKACKIVTEGLTHESADIQEACINFLEKWINPDDKELLAIIDNYKDDIAPSLKSKADNLLEKLGITAQIKEIQSDLKEIKLTDDNLRARIDVQPDTIKSLTGLEDVDKVLNSELIEPLNYELITVPILSALKPIKPIVDIEELIDTVSHAVETIDSADELERILDGISRLCSIKPDNFETRTAPLLKRITPKTGSPSTRGLLTSAGMPVSLTEVLFAWLRLQKVSWEHDFSVHYLNPVKFLDSRLVELRDRLLNKEPAPLLSTPTHSGGWIAPLIFMQRVIELNNSKIKIPKYDLMQALLRLAPDNRKEALVLAKNIKGLEAELIQFALGAEKLPDKIKKEEAPLWLVAARCRNARLKLDFIKKNSLLPLIQSEVFPEGPDVIEPANYSWKIFVEEKTQKIGQFEQHYTFKKIEINHGKTIPELKDIKDWPILALHKLQYQKYVFSYMRSPLLISCLSMIWPQNNDALFAEAAWCLYFRIDQNSSTFEPNYPFLIPLLEADRPFTEMAYLALILGLISKDSDAKGYAVDILATGIEDSRINPDPFSDILLKLSNMDGLMPNRLASSLSEAAKLSPLHAFIIAHTLLLWLSKINELPRDAHYLLSLLNDLTSQLGLKPDGKALDLLKAVKGSTKTAKIAKSLISYTYNNYTNDYFEAKNAQLETRILRAERWNESQANL